jgi:hypothetical protein
LARFLQPDPKEFAAGDYNLYRYCHNDPVNRSDPFGLLEFRFGKDFPIKGVTGRDAIQGEIKKELSKSAKGREILAAKGIVKIHGVNAAHARTGTDYSPDRRVTNFDTYLDHTDSRFQDKVTFRQLFRNKGELPPDDVKGRAVMLGHELAHGVFKMADEHDGGRNIRDNENAIRRELQLSERLTEGGVPIPR